MATKAEIQAQIDALTADLENADTDDEVVVEENGRRVHFKGSKATAILGRFRDLWEEPAGAGEGEEGEGEEGEGEQDPKPKGGGYFNKRRS